MLPAILGLSGLALTDAERGLIREADPAGFILFGRNVGDPAQLRALTNSLREVSERADLPILVDQEGGRVARLRPPHWSAFPAPRRFAELWKAPISAIEAARVNALAIAAMLAEAGINVDCMPVLDVAHEGAHDVIGDRALGAEPMQVAALGRALEDQGLTGGFDLVVAANVMHATADLTTSTARIKELLAPGGRLLLVEIARPLLWLDVVFGASPGWWLRRRLSPDRCASRPPGVGWSTR